MKADLLWELLDRTDQLLSYSRNASRCRAFMVGCCSLVEHLMPAGGKAALEVARAGKDRRFFYGRRMKRAQAECQRERALVKSRVELSCLNAVSCALLWRAPSHEWFESMLQCASWANEAENHGGEQVELFRSLFPESKGVPVQRLRKPE